MPELSDRYRVQIRADVWGDDYRALLSRARIVFNRGIRGECNQRAFEAAAAGALLFQEVGNREVPEYFRDRRECVYYNADNLEELLEYYLVHENERRVIAESARASFRRYGWEVLWSQVLERVQADWPRLQERAGRRMTALDPDGRVWETLGSVRGDDAGLVEDLEAALGAGQGLPAMHEAALHNSLGLAKMARGTKLRSALNTLAESGAFHFRRAVEAAPDHLVAGLNLAEALVMLRKEAAAVEQSRRLLALFERDADTDPAVWDAGRFPPGFDTFRVEWERAAWSNAGQYVRESRAKRDLVRWRLHVLLADLTGDVVHRYQAMLARPDLPETRAGLGLALLRVGHAAEAVEHLRQALADNPFHAEAARVLYQPLGELGDNDGQQQLAQDRRLLAQSAPQLVPAEEWFQFASLTSIMVLCCNQVDCTRLCLESVLRHTRLPYELVLVDNGSTDGTPAFLEGLRTRRGPARVVFLHNEANRGFPAGCNQALAKARGEYLVFLNNDTVVTEGWLAGLARWPAHGQRDIGLVGAVSNYAPPPQLVPGGYADLGGLDAFAARRQAEFAGKALEVDRLTGFCMLVRRDVLERVGGFDEQFGLGFFDDDDLCMRAREAGFRLVVALDVFVHHFGSQTFRALGVDCRQQLQENFARFQEKWGTERTAGYHMPNGTIVAVPAPARGCLSGETARSSTEPIPAFLGARNGKMRVSLSMIVKNEEANLPACLELVADLVDEIVIADTGSIDRTKEVAARFGAKVVDFPWVDSFAAARNESLRHTTGDYVLWLDADDRLDAENRSRLRQLLAELREENAAYAMKCLCLPDQAGGARWRSPVAGGKALRRIGMCWDIAHTRRVVGYELGDDVTRAWRHAATATSVPGARYFAASTCLKRCCSG